MQNSFEVCLIVIIVDTQPCTMLFPHLLNWKLFLDNKKKHSIQNNKEVEMTNKNRQLLPLSQPHQNHNYTEV